jgi:hypothetical protein
MGRLYHQDFYGWTQDQADALRRRSANEIDWDNLLAEIEGLGNSARSELRSRLAVIICHLLKWRHQKLRRTRSWALTVAEQRAQVEDLLEENPSLQSQLDGIMIKAFRAGVSAAADETGLPKRVLQSGGVMAFAEVMTAEAAWPED